MTAYNIGIGLGVYILSTMGVSIKTLFGVAAGTWAICQLIELAKERRKKRG